MATVTPVIPDPQVDATVPGKEPSHDVAQALELPERSSHPEPSMWIFRQSVKLAAAAGESKLSRMTGAVHAATPAAAAPLMRLRRPIEPFACTPSAESS